MKVLHITNWYPNKENDKEALFIREHFESLNDFVESNELYHIRVIESSHWWKLDHNRTGEYTYSIILRSKLARFWKFQELLTLWLLYRFIIPISSGYDVICFHIAYPLVAFPKMIKRWIKMPFCILEHWTAYHFNFNLPKGVKSLNRIRNIFSHKVPLITVSKALETDIIEFSGYSGFESYVLPNVVDKKIFSYVINDLPTDPIFFMVNLWRSIKSPFVIFEGFKRFLLEFPNAKLRVGGYGPLWLEIEEYVIDHHLENQIILLGKMDKGEIALEMNRCSAFVHATTYETFSVVTAEALMCGCPCIVSDISAIREYLDSKSGILVENLECESWHQAMVKFMSHQYNRKKITDKFSNKFSVDTVGRQFYQILDDIINESKR
jgi:glycosyltransferase involved in cell wall biosynthesis